MVADTAHDDSAKQQTHPDPIKTQKKLDEDFFILIIQSGLIHKPTFHNSTNSITVKKSLW